jgi:hypothetical protein
MSDRIMLGFSPCGFVFSNLQLRSGFYETAGVVKVFVFASAFVFSLELIRK